MWRQNPLLEKDRLWSLGRGPLKVPGKVPGVTPVKQMSELLRLQSENVLVKGNVKLLQDQVADRDAQLVAARCEKQRANELLEERDSRLLSERATASKGESGWQTRKKKLPDELDSVRGHHGTGVHRSSTCVGLGCSEDKAWPTQCAVELRTGLLPAATTTALLEDSLKQAVKECAPLPSDAQALDQLLKKYEVGDILQPPRTKGATEALALVMGSPQSKGCGSE